MKRVVREYEVVAVGSSSQLPMSVALIVECLSAHPHRLDLVIDRWMRLREVVVAQACRTQVVDLVAENLGFGGTFVLGRESFQTSEVQNSRQSPRAAAPLVLA